MVQQSKSNCTNVKHKNRLLAAGISASVSSEIIIIEKNIAVVPNLTRGLSSIIGNEFKYFIFYCPISIKLVIIISHTRRS